MHAIDEIAAVIRRHPNNVDTATLAVDLAAYLRRNAEPVADFIDRTNPDRTMGAGTLAESIWNSELYAERCVACDGTAETSEGWECSSCGGSGDVLPTALRVEGE